eukprot:GHVQ01023082.1.p1 GENE.GHVQ01023082.1~~GHVQ01023082.1.p1  ORF type:complete len:648 (+),score=41.69 GHVQ01023082.1:127-2070(+)
MELKPAPDSSADSSSNGFLGSSPTKEPPASPPRRKKHPKVPLLKTGLLKSHFPSSQGRLPVSITPSNSSSKSTVRPAHPPSCCPCFGSVCDLCVPFSIIIDQNEIEFISPPELTSSERAVLTSSDKSSRRQTHGMSDSDESPQTLTTNPRQKQAKTSANKLSTPTPGISSELLTLPPCKPDSTQDTSVITGKLNLWDCDVVDEHHSKSCPLKSKRSTEPIHASTPPLFACEWDCHYRLAGFSCSSRSNSLREFDSPFLNSPLMDGSLELETSHRNGCLPPNVSFFSPIMSSSSQIIDLQDYRFSVTSGPRCHHKQTREGALSAASKKKCLGSETLSAASFVSSASLTNTSLEPNRSTRSLHSMPASGMTALSHRDTASRANTRYSDVRHHTLVGVLDRLSSAEYAKSPPLSYLPTSIVETPPPTPVPRSRYSFFPPHCLNSLLENPQDPVSSLSQRTESDASVPCAMFFSDDLDHNESLARERTARHCCTPVFQLHRSPSQVVEGGELMPRLYHVSSVEPISHTPWELPGTSCAQTPHTNCGEFVDSFEPESWAISPIKRTSYSLSSSEDTSSTLQLLSCLKGHRFEDDSQSNSSLCSPVNVTEEFASMARANISDMNLAEFPYNYYASLRCGHQHRNHIKYREVVL